MGEARTNVIKWDAVGENDILWEYDQEYIRIASVLVVNDWQWAVFMRDGQIIATFEAGKHTLTTANIPILTKIYEKTLGYKEGAFKAKVIFISKKQFLGRWGVRAMVKVAEDYQAPIPLMGNGEYQYRIYDPNLFITQLVAGLKNFSNNEVINFMKSFINEQITQQLSRQYYMDVFSNLEKASLVTKTEIVEFSMKGDVYQTNNNLKGIQTADLRDDEKAVMYEEVNETVFSNEINYETEETTREDVLNDIVLAQFYQYALCYSYRDDASFTKTAFTYEALDRDAYLYQCDDTQEKFVIDAETGLCLLYQSEGELFYCTSITVNIFDIVIPTPTPED